MFVLRHSLWFRQPDPKKGNCGEPLLLKTRGLENITNSLIRWLGPASIQLDLVGCLDLWFGGQEGFPLSLCKNHGSKNISEKSVKLSSEGEE